jgi:GcrA cell cycle regulator
VADWDEDRVAQLKKDWADGLSGSDIARRLGGVTRCAVLGKLHRMGLSGRAASPRTRNRQTQSRAERRRQRLKPKAPPMRYGNPALRQLYASAPEPCAPTEELEIPLNERKTILTRDKDGKLCANDAFNEKSCRWPIGDPQKPDFHFCNKTKVCGLPYCEAHARRAYQPPQPPSRLPNPTLSSAPIMDGGIKALAEFLETA